MKVLRFEGKKDSIKIDFVELEKQTLQGRTRGLLGDVELLLEIFGDGLGEITQYECVFSPGYYHLCRFW